MYVRGNGGEESYVGRRMSVKDILYARYPHLEFLLRFEERGSLPFPLHGEDLDREISQVFALLPLSKLHLIYVYGIGLGYYYFPLEEWLLENRERTLIFIEENLSALRAFLAMDHAPSILRHPQVHIRFNMNKRKLSRFLEECAREFPFERVELLSLASYKRHYASRFHRICLKVRRLTTVHHALFVESFHYHLFFEHFLSNFKRLPGAFFGNYLKGQFKDVPAIICGAGPSLSREIECLRSLDTRALIFAGGSAITALGGCDISPHFGVAADPNDEEYCRLKRSTTFETPIFYVSRVFSQIFNTCNGAYGYLQTLSGGAAERWMEERLGIDGEPLQEGFNIEALSVTTISMQLAATLGCNPIVLVGVDLAFTGKSAYAEGVVCDPRLLLQEREGEVRASEKLLRRRDIYGNPVYTLVKWVMESSAISLFAKKNPHITFINATDGGLGFKDIPHRQLASIPFLKSYDLYGKVHCAIQTHPLSITFKQVMSCLLELKLSFQKAQACVEMALSELKRVQGGGCDPETGKVIFAQMELESLDAYLCFLQGADFYLQRILTYKYRPSTWDTPDGEVKWKILYAKWDFFDHMIKFYLTQMEEDICVQGR